MYKKAQRPEQWQRHERQKEDAKQAHLRKVYHFLLQHLWRIPTPSEFCKWKWDNEVAD